MTKEFIGSSKSEKLINELQILANEKKIMASAATELSFLFEYEQMWVYRLYENYKLKPTLKQARQIRKTFEGGKLTLTEVDRIMKVAERGVPKRVVFRYEDLALFFDKGMSVEKIKEDVMKVLQNWKNNSKRA